jgi:DNA-binding MarR family transcriptional regulator
MSGLKRMKRALNVFKQMDPDLPMSVMIVFLAIADSPDKEVTTRDLIDETGLSASAFSRALLTLSDQHFTKKRDGLHLVEVLFHPEDRRLRLAILTKRGAILADTIEGLLA